MLTENHAHRNRKIFCLCLYLAICWLFPAGARDVSITILHTADVHGSLEACLADSDWKENNHGREQEVQGATGGLLRCASVINRIREQEKNVILIDCGDFFQGSVESFLSRGLVMARVAAAMKYDAFVVGNHEFDWGVETLRKFYREARIPVLSSGLVTPPGFSLPFAEPWLVREIEGVRLVIVGLTNPLIPNWSRPRLLGEICFQDVFEALSATLAEARKISPDILVLAAHQGWREWGDDMANKINGIAQRFPDFDLIIGAHTHQAVEAREVNRIAYTQAGSHARWLGKVDLVYDNGLRKLVKIKPGLISVDGTVPEDAGLGALVAADIRAAKKYLANRIGENRRELTPAAGHDGQSGIQTLISAALAEAVEADVVMHGTLTSSSLPAGIVRMADVWRIIPYENTIGRAALTMDEIRAVLEENAGYYGKPQFRGVYGIIYDLNINAPAGKRVSNLRLRTGRKPQEGERIYFAVNSYDLASAGGRFPLLRQTMERSSSGLAEIDLDTRAALVSYIRGHSPLDIQAAQGAVINNKKK